VVVDIFFLAFLNNDSHAVHEIALTDVDAIRRSRNAESQQTGIHFLHLLLRLLGFRLISNRKCIILDNDARMNLTQFSVFTLTSWKSDDCPGFMALAGMHMLSSSYCWTFLCIWRQRERWSRNCLANSLASLPSPRYKRTYSWTSNGDSTSYGSKKEIIMKCKQEKNTFQQGFSTLRKATNVGTSICAWTFFRYSKHH
jgi:hypothetical protein